jgi:DNA-binding beta-propeller fold protein YncE
MNWTRPLQAVAIRAGLWLALAALGTMLAAALVTPVLAATFGTVVPIGGQAADIALDEPRGVLYIANFTANRIDVMSLSDNTIHTSYHVAGQPASLSLSPDGSYLVVAHFGNFAAP